MSGQSGGGQVQGGQGGQPQGGQPPGGYQQGGGGGDEMVDYAKLGAVAYAVVGLGMFFTRAFIQMIGDNQAGLFQGAQSDALFFGVTSALPDVITAAPLLAAALAVYYHTSDQTMEPAYKPAAVAAAAGFLLIGFVMLLLATIFVPSGGNVELGKEFPGLLGGLFGTVITAAAVGAVLDNDNLDVM